MSSTALYKALTEAGASEDRADKASADVVQMSQLSQLLKSEFKNMENSLIKWMVSIGLVGAGLVIAGFHVIVQVLTS